RGFWSRVCRIERRDRLAVLEQPAARALGGERAACLFPVRVGPRMDERLGGLDDRWQPDAGRCHRWLRPAAAAFGRNPRPQRAVVADDVAAIAIRAHLAGGRRGHVIALEAGLARAEAIHTAAGAAHARARMRVVDVLDRRIADGELEEVLWR